MAKKRNWDLVEDMLRNAKAMHFDGCHKIYLSMDDQQVEKMRSYGYEVVEPNLKTLKDWYETSCGLRSIDAVFTHEDPNKGFVDLIAQFEDTDEEVDH